ncbi:uncharacterized protein H6S33_009495 [Morchella sextelata]|uniref:uncharacterized protein n=1 Tax=Morchella sextelata TaxID=1174677 RepID=UPI001D03D9D6|nr:uncharacterized protein H6S33_009495 [Morchella sextelata]KAH0613115.1 hypothetical protein H6S33_009495 [Morchella sextelata]
MSSALGQNQLLIEIRRQDPPTKSSDQDANPRKGDVLVRLSLWGSVTRPILLTHEISLDISGNDNATADTDTVLAHIRTSHRKWLMHTSVLHRDPRIKKDGTPSFWLDMGPHMYIRPMVYYHP